MDVVTKTMAQRVEEVRAKGEFFAGNNLAVWRELVSVHGCPSDEVAAVFAAEAKSEEEAYKKASDEIVASMRDLADEVAS